MLKTNSRWPRLVLNLVQLSFPPNLYMHAMRRFKEGSWMSCVLLNNYCHRWDIPPEKQSVDIINVCVLLFYMHPYAHNNYQASLTRVVIIDILKLLMTDNSIMVTVSWKIIHCSSSLFTSHPANEKGNQLCLILSLFDNMK